MRDAQESRHRPKPGGLRLATFKQIHSFLSFVIVGLIFLSSISLHQGKEMESTKGDPDLCVALRHAGYHNNQRIFTAKQVTIIYDYLGNPITEPELRNIM